jgi:ATP-dependent helicase/nuclease subunit A
MAVLEDPAFAAVFAEGSRAEVEIIGRLASGRGTEAVAGRVDRLAITPAEVLIVDYKTNRPAPASLAEAPRGYIAQLAIYRQVLAGLYPGRRIGAALLWTDAPRLMEIPADAMDAALAAVLGRDR